MVGRGRFRRRNTAGRPIRRSRPREPGRCRATGPPTRATAGATTTGRPALQLNLRTADGSDRWGFGARITDLQGLPDAALDGSAADVRFTLAREAGSFAFTGSFTDRRGSGRYTFTPNPAYTTAMAGAGLRLPVARGRHEAGRARREHGVREGHPQRRPDLARHSTS